MNCKQVLEHISSAVDNVLEQGTRKDFDAHIKECVVCRTEFELESLTKRVLQRNVTHQPIPPDLAAKLTGQISAYGATVANPEGFSWIWRWLTFPQWKPALALGIAGIAGWFLFTSLPLNSRHLHTSPNDNNIIHESFNNFDALLNGTLQPQVASNDPSVLRNFFAQTVSYEVNVPQMDECKLIGGMLSVCNGHKAAHVVYQHGRDVIYLYQVDFQEVLAGTVCILSPQAKEELLRTGWYVIADHPKCTLAMWVKGNTLCTAVADIEKNELIAYLSYAD